MISLYQAIKAALFFAAKDDIRYFLNGVYIKSEEGVTTVAATNGHTAFMTTLPPSIKKDFEVIISREDAALALRLGSENFTFDGAYFCDKLLVTPIAGKYPNMDLIFKTHLKGRLVEEGIQVQSKYLVQAERAGRALGNKGIKIQARLRKGSGHPTAVIEYPTLPDTHVLIMPYLLREV